MSKQFIDDLSNSKILYTDNKYEIICGGFGCNIKDYCIKYIPNAIHFMENVENKLIINGLSLQYMINTNSICPMFINIDDLSL